MSRVMAMWMIEGLWEFLSTEEDHVVLGHSLPFRNAGASRNSGRLPEDEEEVAGKITVPVTARKRQRRWSFDDMVEFGEIA